MSASKLPPQWRQLSIQELGNLEVNQVEKAEYWQLFYDNVGPEVADKYTMLQFTNDEGFDAFRLTLKSQVKVQQRSRPNSKDSKSFRSQ